MGKMGDDIRRFKSLVVTRQDEIVTEVVGRCALSLIDLSARGDPSLWKNKAPKNYVAGRFVANWRCGVNGVNSLTTDETDRDGGPTLDRIVGSIPKNAGGNVYYLTNSLPYAIPLENGHSSQSPLGMVTLTAIMFMDFVGDALRLTTINGRSFAA